MENVNTIGMIMYLLLALFGGFLTGLFSRYIYQAAYKDFGRLIAVICSIVFYVAPGWALISLFKEDDLDVFYLLLIASFIYGVFFFNRFADEDTPHEHHYAPPDDD
jgi:hypothetical protein